MRGDHGPMEKRIRAITAAGLTILAAVFCFSQKEYDSKNTQIEKLEKIGLYRYPQDQSRF